MNNVNQWPEDMEVIERCVTSRGELTLRRRKEHYEIISNGTFLMATYNGESERQLVKVALQACSQPRRVLIGGLGVGFSLQEALKDLRVEQVTVIEIEREIIRWNRTILAPISGFSLNDQRTRIIETDLLQWLQTTEEKFNIIGLDIDNGPDWTVFATNQPLYEIAGLRRLNDMLEEGGVLTFWSASSAPQFSQRLQEFFGSVGEITVEQEKGEPDYVFYVRKV